MLFIGSVIKGNQQPINQAAQQNKANNKANNLIMSLIAHE